MEVHHQLMLGRFLQQDLVQIDDILGFVIEEIDFYANHARVLAQTEELLASLRSTQRPTIFPQPDSDVLVA